MVAFEPAKQASKRLHENISINQLKNVKVHACALGDREGIVEFLDQRDTMNRMITPADEGGSRISVPVARLDDMVTFKCAMGKMDIEGAEPLAFRGGSRKLAEINPPVWMLELNGSLHAYGFTEAEFSDWLTERGYDLCLYDANRQELKFSATSPWLVSPNVFAIARSMKQEVAQRIGARLV